MIEKTARLDGNFHVGSQPELDDLSALQDDGFEMIINNRPDAEEAGQPTDAAMERECADLGLDYAHVPIGRGISPADVAAEREALDRAKGRKTFAFCRSGTRSTLVWALAEHDAGRDVGELRDRAQAAGYSLDPVNHLL